MPASREKTSARTPGRARRLLAAAAGWAGLALAGCTSPSEYVRNGFKVGPNYGRAPAPTAEGWIDAAARRVRKDVDPPSAWWKVFDDPLLDGMICDAYRQNLTLRQAGFRVLQARAQREIAV